MAENRTEALAQIIKLLEPLTEEERARTVRAALTFLGSETLGPRTEPSARTPGQPLSSDHEQSFSPRALRWLQQNHLQAAILESVFHVSNGDVQIIAADVPGTSQKVKTRQCYLLSGVRGLLQTGEPRIDDNAARELCRRIGCYDGTNHATYVKSLRNLITGSKESGFELTQPGLRAAADLIRETTGGQTTT